MVQRSLCESSQKPSRAHLKLAHRAVPEHRLAVHDLPCEMLSGGGTHIHAKAVRGYAWCLDSAAIQGELELL